MSGEFVECDSCRAKPGSPILCASCLKRRESAYPHTVFMNPARMVPLDPSKPCGLAQEDGSWVHKQDPPFTPSTAFDYANSLQGLHAAIREWARTSKHNRMPWRVRLSPKAFVAVQEAKARAGHNNEDAYMGVSLVADRNLGEGSCPQVLAVDGEAPAPVAPPTAAILRTRCGCEREHDDSGSPSKEISVPMHRKVGPRGFSGTNDFQPMLMNEFVVDIRRFRYNGAHYKDGKRVFEEVAEAPPGYDHSACAKANKAAWMAAHEFRLERDKLLAENRRLAKELDTARGCSTVSETQVVLALKDNLRYMTERRDALNDALFQRDQYEADVYAAAGKEETRSARTLAELAPGSKDNASRCSFCGASPAPHVTHFAGPNRMPAWLCFKCAKEYGHGRLGKAPVAVKAPGWIARFRAFVSERNRALVALALTPVVIGAGAVIYTHAGALLDAFR